MFFILCFLSCAADIYVQGVVGAGAGARGRAELRASRSSRGCCYRAAVEPYLNPVADSDSAAVEPCLNPVARFRTGGSFGMLSSPLVQT